MKITSIFVLVLITASCQQHKEDYLVKIYKGELDEIGVESGYVNLKGDTVIQMGKYYYCYTDTLREFAIVMEKNGKAIGIDQNENKLFEVFWFDNGPDPVADGLFRIRKGDKIGYANEKGVIVIAPQYAYAFPFEDGKARVAYQCETVIEGEHHSWESRHWLYIDKKGNTIEE